MTAHQNINEGQLLKFLISGVVTHPATPQMMPMYQIYYYYNMYVCLFSIVLVKIFFF